MKEVFIMKNVYLKSVSVHSLNCEIVWCLGEEERISMMYHHSDGSWGFDADTQKLDPSERDALKKALLARIAPPKKEAAPPKKAKKPFDPNRVRISVWRSVD